MRSLAVFVLAVVAACARAAPAPHVEPTPNDAACLEPDPRTILAQFTASGHTLTMCLDHTERAPDDCIAIDVVANTWTYSGAMKPAVQPKVGYAREPVHVAGTKWATTEGSTVVIVDSTIGGEQRVALPERDDACTYCVGNSENDRVPEVVVLGNGDLAALSALGVTIIDGKSYAMKRTLAFPRCQSPPPAPPG